MKLDRDPRRPDPPPELDTELHRLRDRLREHVTALAERIGERNVRHPDRYGRAADHIRSAFEAAGWAVEEQRFDAAGTTCRNLDARPGRHADGTPPPVIIAAHYDTVDGSPGADDNATGVAALLVLAERLGERPTARPIRLVAFANEEPPFFHGPDMGSHRYAAACRADGQTIDAMLALDGLGCFRDEPGTQSYPAGMAGAFPDRGDFIALVADKASESEFDAMLDAFRAAADVPAHGAVVPGEIPGAAWSDHWAFWQHGYPGVMATDTLPFRYPQYHTPNDTPDRIDWPRFTHVCTGIEAIARRLAGE